MKYYVEITISDSAGSVEKAWTSLFTQLHLALVECKNSDETGNIGFSFPDYHYNPVRQIGCIGSCIRAFAKERGDLLKFMASLDLSRLEKWLNITTVKEVKTEKITGYSLFLRKQDKANAARLARRQAKRHPEFKFENLLKTYENNTKMLNFPYIDMKSLSSNRKFRLFIEKRKVDTNSGNGKFNVYGLGIETPVPEF